jgi:hypothetical protein
MFNCHNFLTLFYEERVALTNSMKEGMRNRRRANQERLARGLRGIKPLRHVKQGSYAMHTMVQSEYTTSDIDDGVIFAKTDLITASGIECSPQDAKIMVCKAINDNSFKRPPQIKTNCIRVYYNDGFTIDIPVYREINHPNGTHYELASTTWKLSDPEGVTTWFNKTVIEKSPDEENGRQMRRIVRLLKAWCRSRNSWNMPSGLILSKLIDENYYKNNLLLNRDDQALLQTMESIFNRLQYSLEVTHPVVKGENITKTNQDSDMIEFRDRLGSAIQTLSTLRKSNCSDIDALKALRDFFFTDFFDKNIFLLENKKSEISDSLESIFVGDNEPSSPVIKKGGTGRYA